MTNTLHPWTMYEVARYRDEERLLRSEAAMRALKPQEAQARTPGSGNPRQTISWADRVREGLSGWAQSHHLLPHHARHG